MPTINDAIAAYKTTAQRPVFESASGAGGAEGPTFGSMVKDAVNGAIDASRKGEAVTAAATTGKANMTDVAMAVNNADITLQSVVAIRDKVVSAYQQIMNMPI